MTKEELKQEAEEFSAKYLKAFTDRSHIWSNDKLMQLILKDGCKDGYLASAEPREKQIQIDAEQIRALQKDKGELTDRVKELEAQIEKMKNCKNCANYMISGKCPWFFRTGWCKNWELSK